EILVESEWMPKWLMASIINSQIIYSGYSCTQDWLFTPCSTDLGLFCVLPERWHASFVMVELISAKHITDQRYTRMQMWPDHHAVTFRLE
ncbi:hypothetical protein S83_011384, partial [Arachis hypogaea]